MLRNTVSDEYAARREGEVDAQELVQAFTVDRILKKSAVFDPEKLIWLNRQHIERIMPGSSSELMKFWKYGTPYFAVSCISKSPISVSQGNSVVTLYVGIGNEKIRP